MKLIANRFALGSAGIVVAGITGATMVLFGAGTFSKDAPHAAQRAALPAPVTQSFRILREPAAPLDTALQQRLLKVADLAVSTQASGGKSSNADPAAKTFTSSQVDPAGLRLVRDQPNLKVAIIPDPSLICLWSQVEGGAGAVDCAIAESAADAKRPLMSATILGDGRWRVTGLMVDGIRSAAIQSAEGAVVAPVVDNVFSAVVDHTPTAVTWDGPDGPERQQWSHLSD
jgi:hypothetical protein